VSYGTWKQFLLMIMGEHSIEATAICVILIPFERVKNVEYE
jgi:hypothetical protein